MSKLTTALKFYGIISFTYLVLALLLPANHQAQQAYHLSSAAYHVLIFIIILPLLGIWFGAFYSYGRLEQYSDAIESTPEGLDFEKLTSGFKWIAWGSALTSVCSMLLNAISNQHSGFTATAIIVSNYLALLVPLVGFSRISSASHGLNSRAKVRVSNGGSKGLILAFMVLGAVYCFVTFQQLDLHSVSANTNPYYIPAWLMVLTLIVPYLYTWFIGFLAAYEMYLYSKHVDGVLYKQAIRQLSFGVIAVIVSSIIVQYLRSAVPRTGHLSLNSILMLVNIIYLIMASGYVFLSLGARQLRKIEEV